VLFCLDKKAHLYPVFRRAGSFAVNILGAAQENVSRHFANYRLYPEPKNMWDRPQKGCPILRGTLGWTVCQKTAVYKGGDHDIFLAEATGLHVRKGSHNPLLYVHGQYRKIAK
jgi:flavin reductase (DIM6/NTAB) family NADH-FMN oxidoreductase RutF